MLCIHFNKETHECSAYNLDEKFQGCNTEGTCTVAGLEYPDDVCEQYNPGVEEDEDDGDVEGTGEDDD
jgi:hypothetical protein